MTAYLSNRQVVQLHQLAQQGMTGGQIARILDCHRNTVLDHLAFRVPYPTEVIRKIHLCDSFQLPVGDKIPLYQAAVYLPGWPSRAKCYMLHCAGVIKAQRDKHFRCWVVTPEALREAARKMLPEGLWIRSDHLHIYAGHAVAERCRPHRIDSKYWPYNAWGYIDAMLVSATCREMSEELRVPAKDVHRAMRALELTTVATL